jgi:hypothetical protein
LGGLWSEVMLAELCMNLVVFGRFFFPIGPVKPPPSGSGLPDRFDRKMVEFKIKFKSACSTGSDWFTIRFDRLPVGFSGNRLNSNFFLFWFKFKCPQSMQSILNECLYNMF